MASTFARDLRQTPTDAELRLWSRIRKKQLGGFRLRRQHPIGRYIVDFFCAEAKLIVEVDAGQHADESDERATWLESKGYRLVRFWNNEMLANTEGVLTVILDMLHHPPPPGNAEALPTSPSRGEALLRQGGSDDHPNVNANA